MKPFDGLEPTTSSLAKPKIKIKNYHYHHYLCSFLFDVIYTIGPLGIASVLVWAGVWGIQDHLLFPNEKIKSATCSLCIAIILTIICHCLRTKITTSQRITTITTKINNINNETTTTTNSYCCGTNNNNNSSSSFGNIMCTILVLISGVCYWRGVWMLWENCILVSYPLYRSILAAIISIIVLIATDNFKTTVVGPPILFPSSLSTTNQESSSSLSTSRMIVSVQDVQIKNFQDENDVMAADDEGDNNSDQFDPNDKKPLI